MKKVVFALVFFSSMVTFSGCQLMPASEDVFPNEKLSGPLNTDDEEDQKNKPK